MCTSTCTQISLALDQPSNCTWNTNCAINLNLFNNTSITLYEKWSPSAAACMHICTSMCLCWSMVVSSSDHWTKNPSFKHHTYISIYVYIYISTKPIFKSLIAPSLFRFYLVFLFALQLFVHQSTKAIAIHSLGLDFNWKK